MTGKSRADYWGILIQRGKTRKKLSRLLEILDTDFKPNETDFLDNVNLAQLNYGDDFIEPFMERYYVLLAENDET